MPYGIVPARLVRRHGAFGMGRRRGAGLYATLQQYHFRLAAFPHHSTKQWMDGRRMERTYGAKTCDMVVPPVDGILLLAIIYLFWWFVPLVCLCVGTGTCLMSLAGLPSSDPILQFSSVPVSLLVCLLFKCTYYLCVFTVSNLPFI